MNEKDERIITAALCGSYMAMCGVSEEEISKLCWGEADEIIKNLKQTSKDNNESE